jgi:hypothetical protein
VIRRAVAVILVSVCAWLMLGAAPGTAQTDDPATMSGGRQPALQQSASATSLPLMGVVAGLAVLGSTLGVISVRRRAEMAERTLVGTATVRLTPRQDGTREPALVGSVSASSQS